MSNKQVNRICKRLIVGGGIPAVIMALIGWVWPALILTVAIELAVFYIIVTNLPTSRR